MQSMRPFSGAELGVKWKEFLDEVEAEKRADGYTWIWTSPQFLVRQKLFRYEYDLITAEETEAWLANRGLTFEDFSDYFTGQYLCHRDSRKRRSG